MSYKVFLWDNLSSIEWSQVWRLAGQTEVDVHECDIEQVREVLLRELPRDGLAIDAGCGDGKWPVFLTRRRLPRHRPRHRARGCAPRARCRAGADGAAG